MGATDVSVIPDRQVVFPETVFQPGKATETPLLVRGVTGQSADYFRIEDSESATVTRWASNGALVVSGPIGVGIFGAAGVENRVTDGALRVETGSAARAGLIIRGMASQTGNLLQLENSAGNVLTRFANGGGLVIGGPNLTDQMANVTGYLNVQSRAAANPAAIFRSAPSPTVNTFEVQRSDGSLAFLVGDNGTQVDGRSAPIDSERFISWASANQTQAVIQARTSAGAGIFSVYPSYVQYHNDRFGYFGPNSSWGAYLRVGGNNSQPGVGVAAVAASNGNLHIDCATGTVPTPSSPAGIYLNWYSGATHGTMFGNGDAGQVGRVDEGGAASFVSVTSTSRLDTKKNVERVLETGPDDEKLMRLSAVKYIPTLDRHERPLHSFVAEEVVEVMPEIVTKDENDEIVGINLTSLVTILTTQVQNLTARVRELEAR